LLIWQLRASAVIDHSPDLTGMVTRILWRAPDAGDAEFAAAAGLIVVGAVNLSPGM
jgi:hypothetical protein